MKTKKINFIAFCAIVVGFLFAACSKQDNVSGVHNSDENKKTVSVETYDFSVTCSNDSLEITTYGMFENNQIYYVKQMGGETIYSYEAEVEDYSLSYIYIERDNNETALVRIPDLINEDYHKIYFKNIYQDETSLYFDVTVDEVFLFHCTIYSKAGFESDFIEDLPLEIVYHAKRPGSWTKYLGYLVPSMAEVVRMLVEAEINADRAAACYARMKDASSECYANGGFPKEIHNNNHISCSFECKEK